MKKPYEKPELRVLGIDFMHHVPRPARQTNEQKGGIALAAGAFEGFSHQKTITIYNMMMDLWRK
jgi:hypothetical protein